MQWLTALLAFATTMLIFAIIVSTLVELIHRAFGYREQGMELMLRNLFTQVIEPRLTGADRPDAAQFAALIMDNRAVKPGQGDPERGRISKFMHWLVSSSVMTDIPVEVFTQKLADNRIVSAADNWTDEIVADIGQKYEAFGKEVGTYFERRARVFSIIVAFAVAWMFYVHPYKIAVTYIKNPEVAQAVADKAAEAHADYRALAEKMEAMLPAAGAAEDGALKKAIDELKAGIEDSRNKAQSLKDVGVPVGWPAGDAQVENCRGSSAKPAAKLATTLARSRPGVSTRR